jgi:hypothetical protein
MEGTPKIMAVIAVIIGFSLINFKFTDLEFKLNPRIKIVIPASHSSIVSRERSKTVKIKPMLARLQSAIGRDGLIEEMVLLPHIQNSSSQKVSDSLRGEAMAKSINLIVGYDGSPESHTALDIAFWISHQTTLATNNQVTVQAVYVVEDNFNYQSVDMFNLPDHQPSLERELKNISKPVNFLLTQPKVTAILPHLETEFRNSLKEADRILWQGSFKSHLRFGNIAKEFKKVVQSESADILLLGCQSGDHPMIENLGNNFPCVVLGIPNSL